MNISLFRWMTLIGYFGTLALLLNWFTWLAPPKVVPRGFLLIALVVPLMFPLMGIIRGNPYTHSWTSFLSLLYFVIGIDVAFYYPQQRWLGLALIVLSLVLFTGCVFFAKLEKIRLGKLPY